MNSTPPSNPNPLWVRIGIVAGSALVVVCAALIQHRWVQGIPLQPQLYVMPLMVGTSFGLLVLRIRSVAAENRRYAEVLAARESEILDQNRRLEERVDQGERALAIQEDALRRAQKMEAIGQLANGIAHDFNNLLTVVLSNAAWARESAQGEVGEALSDIVAACERGSRLTRQLLQVSRRREEAPVQVELSEAIDELLPLLSRLIGSRYVLRAEHLGAPAVEVDRSQLDQVLLNLVVNARDAMKDGGPLVVRTLAERGGGALLEVVDVGTGIPPEVADRVFEPFFTSKGPGEGTGLGLSTVRAIVHRVGGTVTFVTSPRGTTFRVRFPAPSGSTEAPPRVPTGPGPDSAVVLVIEPDPDVRELLVSTLGRRGLEVRSAATAAGALELARAAHGVALVVADARLPDAPTEPMLAELRRLHPDVGVVLAGEPSGSSPPDPRVRWIGKPYTTRELSALVDELSAA